MNITVMTRRYVTSRLVLSCVGSVGHTALVVSPVRAPGLYEYTHSVSWPDVVKSD